MEDGVWSETGAGVPQGAVISPLLSNVYPHYVLDQWTDQWPQAAHGEMTIVRYADAILDFERQDEAERYLRELKEHLHEYGLELNEEKTRLMRFGGFARHNRAECGEEKPESFTFLGFQQTDGRYFHLFGANAGILDWQVVPSGRAGKRTFDHDSGRQLL